MSIFTNWPQQAWLMLRKPSSIKKSDYTYQWLGDVDMRMYAKFDQIWSKYTMWYKSYEHFH